MKIAIAGTGYVGLVAGVCFAEVGHKVICVDINKEKIAMLKRGYSPIYEDGLEDLMKKNYESDRIEFTCDYKTAYGNSDVIFIGVGTPELPDGDANLSYVKSVAKQIAQSVEKDCLVVVKSTVPVGTNEKIEKYINKYLKKDICIEVASNPEFLSQGRAVYDMLHASRIIIGTDSLNAQKILKEIYKPFNIPIVLVSRKSAEMIKYASNDFLALKISYMNELANLCEKVGVDIKEVAKGMSYDGRIGKGFLDAGIGYGGSCFPKDMKALQFLAKKNGCRLSILEAAQKVNEKQKTILFYEALQNKKILNGDKVAILGLTFKPNTDDYRHAPSIDNVLLLLKQGVNIYAYDPVGMDNYKKIIDEPRMNFVLSPKEALVDADICFIFTEWKQIQDIKPKDYKEYMKSPIVYDGRNIYDIDEMIKEGIEYYCVGRKISKKFS